jgi:hypothetical protein
MRTLKLSGLLALPLAFGLAACSSTTYETPAPAPSAGAGATTSTTTVTTDTVRTDTVSVTTTTTGTVTAGAAAGQPRMLTLESANNSGFTGNATITDLGNKVRVAVTLNAPANSDKDADHNAHIRMGTCAAPGAIMHELSDVEGNGQASNTELDMLASALMNGSHIITANENPGDRVVACVAIPQAGM